MGAYKINVDHKVHISLNHLSNSYGERESSVDAMSISSFLYASTMIFLSAQAHIHTPHWPIIKRFFFKYSMVKSIASFRLNRINNDNLRYVQWSPTILKPEKILISYEYVCDRHQWKVWKFTMRNVPFFSLSFFIWPWIIFRLMILAITLQLLTSIAERQPIIWLFAPKNCNESSNQKEENTKFITKLIHVISFGEIGMFCPFASNAQRLQNISFSWLSPVNFHYTMWMPSNGFFSHSTDHPNIKCVYCIRILVLCVDIVPLSNNFSRIEKKLNDIYVNS